MKKSILILFTVASVAVTACQNGNADKTAGAADSTAVSADSLNNNAAAQGMNPGDTLQNPNETENDGDDFVPEP